MNQKTNEQRRKNKEANVRFRCGKCDREYSRMDALTVHQKSCGEIPAVSEAKKPELFSCAKCDAKYVRKETLVKHQRKCDPESVNRVSCAKCEKDFANAKQLEHHDRKVHLIVSEISGDSNVL
jgi:hypothetical protein